MSKIPKTQKPKKIPKIDFQLDIRKAYKTHKIKPAEDKLILESKAVTLVNYVLKSLAENIVMESCEKMRESKRATVAVSDIRNTTVGILETHVSNVCLMLAENALIHFKNITVEELDASQAGKTKRTTKSSRAGLVFSVPHVEKLFAQQKLTGATVDTPVKKQETAVVYLTAVLECVCVLLLKAARCECFTRSSQSTNKQMAIKPDDVFKATEEGFIKHRDFLFH